METKLQNIYPTDYNFLIAQDLWRAHYQFLSIIFRKEFIELNVNMDMMIKNVELAELIIGKCLIKKIERFFNIYKFYNHDNNKFILLLLKVAYPYEDVDDW